MNTHKVDQIYEKAWGRLYNPMKFYLFMRTGFYNGESKWKWRRLLCWFGTHNYSGHTFVEQKTKEFIFKPQCNHCNHQAKWVVVPTWDSDNIIHQILMGGIPKKEILQKLKKIGYVK